MGVVSTCREQSDGHTRPTRTVREEQRQAVAQPPHSHCFWPVGHIHPAVLTKSDWRYACCQARGAVNGSEGGWGRDAKTLQLQRRVTYCVCQGGHVMACKVESTATNKSTHVTTSIFCRPVWPQKWCGVFRLSHARAKQNAQCTTPPTTRHARMPKSAMTRHSQPRQVDGQGKCA